MAKPATAKTEQPAIVLDRQATATLGPVVSIKLDQIVLQPEIYRHRKATDLEAKKIALKELCDNLIVEGQRDPLVVYQDDKPVDPDRPYILVAGHRRHAAMQILADKSTPNFTRDMQVTALRTRRRDQGRLPTIVRQRQPLPRTARLPTPDLRSRKFAQGRIAPHPDQDKPATKRQRLRPLQTLVRVSVDDRARGTGQSLPV